MKNAVMSVVTRTLRVHLYAITACVLIQATTHTARAQQMLLVDSTRTWSAPDKPVSFSGQPCARTNWLTPVDYYGGQVHVSVEVLSKPTATPFGLKMSLDMAGGGGIDVPLPRSYGPGIYMKSICVRSLRSQSILAKPPSEGVFMKRFEGGVKGVSIKQDTCSQTPAAKPTGPSAHFPMTLRVRVWAVAGKGKLNPHWSYDGLKYAEIKKLRPAAVQIAGGRLGRALSIAKRRAADGDAETAREAQEIANALERHAARRRSELFGVRMESPQHVLKQHRALAIAYSGSDLGKEILAENKAWSKDEGIRAAIQAQAVLADFERKLKVLTQKLGGKSVGDPASARYKAQIAAVRYQLQVLEKRYGQTPSYRRASSLAMVIGLSTSETPLAVAATRPGCVPPPPPAPKKRRRAPPPPPRRPAPRRPQPAARRLPPMGGGAVVDAKPAELVENGGFETKEGKGRFAHGWTTKQFGEFKTRYIARLDRTNPHAGERALDMRGIQRGAKPGAFTTVDIQPGTYVLTFWACGDLGEQPEIGISLGTIEEWRFTANENYRKFEKKILVHDRQRNAKLSIWVETPKSRVWIDEVSVMWTAFETEE